MKSLVLLFFVFISVTISAQEQYLLLPEEQTLFAYKYSNGSLTNLGATNFQITKLFHIESDQFVIINSDSSGILFGTFTANGTSTHFEKKLPSDFNAISIFLFDGFIFIGGNWNSGDFFLVLDTKTEEWTKIKIPEEVYFPGKGIDDFFMLDTLLVAVDNIVIPKFLLFYDTKSLPDLTLIKTFELDDNGAYESIHKGINSGKYIGLLSSSGGCCNSADNLQVLNSENLSQGFTLSKETSISYKPDWFDLEIVENKIYLATRNGLGIIKIKEKYFEDFDRSYRKNKNKSITSRKIRYKLFSPKNIRQIIKLYDDELILVYKDNEDKYRFKFN